MIGATRYFGRRMFAPRYWPKLGGIPAPFQIGWARGSNVLLRRPRA